MGRGQQRHRGARGAGRGRRRSHGLSRAQQPAGRGRDRALAAARRLRLGEPEDAVAAARPRRGQRPCLDHRRLRRHRRDRHGRDGIRPRSSGDAQSPARHAYRRAARERHRRRLRGGVGAAARALRQGPHAAHRQHHHRPLAHRRHRAGHGTRRPRPAPHAHRWLCANEAAPATPLPRSPKGNCASSARASPARSSCCSSASPQGVGRRAPRVLQVGSRTLVSDRNERNWRSLVAKRFGSRAAFVGIDLLEGSNVDHVLDICSEPQALKAKLGEEPFDLVICCHVLEHTRRAGAGRAQHRRASCGRAAWPTSRRRGRRPSTPRRTITGASRCAA